MSKEIHNLHEIILTLLFSQEFFIKLKIILTTGDDCTVDCPSPINSKEHNLKLKYLNSQEGKILTRFLHYVSQFKHRT